jgi:D-inositol-3-phosphate glycosyltransferase
MRQNLSMDCHGHDRSVGLQAHQLGAGVAVALLTGGADRPYAYGLATALISKGVALDVIGNDELDCPEFHRNPGVNFFNLRGSQRSDASCATKALRVLRYYAKLIRYAAVAKPVIFHILWNNKFDTFDRTLLMIYYKLLGKKVVMTVHNVNAGTRDRNDSLFNRVTLGIQYRLASHIFLHTEKMKAELITQFHVQTSNVSVIPFGINNAVPHTSLTRDEARHRLGISVSERVILFFGHITPYKGLEYLIAAFQQIRVQSGEYRLLIAGRPSNCGTYWSAIQDTIREDTERGHVLLKAEFIPDEETEVYFKAADVFVLPYRHVYQSGVLFLGQSFGLPVLAADVGSLKNEIMEGKTGFIFISEDPVDLSRAIERYFASDIYTNLDDRRKQIRDHAAVSHSWDIVSHTTMNLYALLLSKQQATADSAVMTQEDLRV